LTAAIRKSFGERQYEKFMNEQNAELDKTVTDRLTKLQDGLVKRLGDEKGSKVYAQIRDAILSGAQIKMGANFEVISGLAQEAVDGLDEAVKKQGNTTLRIYIADIIQAQKLTDALDKKARSRFGIEDWADMEGQHPDDVKKDLPGEETKNRQYWEKKQKEAQAQRDALDTVKKGTDEWNKYTAEILAAQKELEKYDLKKEADSKPADSRTEKDAQVQADLQTKIANNASKAALERRKAELDSQQKLLDTEQDGFDKREKQIALNYQKELLAIDRHARELVEKQQEAERLQWEKDGKKGAFKPQTVSTLQLPREQKNELIKQEAALNKTLASETERLFREQLE
jgi:hypothetical protein